MADQEGTTIQRNNVYVQNCVFGGGGAHTAVSPAADGTDALTAVVPEDGAELISVTFTVTTIGAVTTSGTQQWSVSDGTNVLFTQAATDAVDVVGTVRTLVVGTATNGKAIASTVGTRLILTNTEDGTVGTGVAGIFRLVWAL